MAEMNGVRDLSYDFVACIGHFLGRDEDIFTLFEGQNNPLVFGRPLDPTPPPPVGIALAVDADAGTVPGGAADGPDQAALPAALDPPLRPAGEPLPSERDALDRELYPHEESPEGYGSSANSSSANLAGMQGDSGAPGSATAKVTGRGGWMGRRLGVGMLTVLYGIWLLRHKLALALAPHRDTPTHLIWPSCPRSQRLPVRRRPCGPRQTNTRGYRGTPRPC